VVAPRQADDLLEQLMQSASPFRERQTVAADLDQVARFFGLKPTGRTMEELTGLSASTLGRASQGTAGVDASKHIAVLAALTKELAGYWKREKQGSAGKPAPMGMQRWLLVGRTLTIDGPRTPLEVLSDPGRAERLLVELRKLRWESGEYDIPNQAATIGDLKPSRDRTSTRRTSVATMKVR
jgi:hypothetical protein